MMTIAQGALNTHADALNPDLRAWLETDPNHASKRTKTAVDLRADLLKNPVDEGVLTDLLVLAQQCGVGKPRDRMLAGKHINTTEDHAVLYATLRRPDTDKLIVDGQDAIANVHGAPVKAYDFVGRVRSGEWIRVADEAVKTIVNVSVGGFDLGPVTVCEVFKPFVRGGLECRFISDIDPTDAGKTMRDLDPETTLMIVVSKTFTTLEMITNAKVVYGWFLSSLCERGLARNKVEEKEAITRHFVVVSTILNEVAELGIGPNNAFGFWSWVSDRYLVDSAVGTSLVIVIDPDGFKEFLAGLNAIDGHFLNAVPEQDVPLLMGLLNVWYSNFLGADTYAVLSYPQYLYRSPAYLQQLTMKLNGKSVRYDGIPVTYETGEVFWGKPGTNGQRASYRFVHQDMRMVPTDFVAFANPTRPLRGGEADMHELLLSNFFAQMKVLAFGKALEEVCAEDIPEAIIPTRVSTGNRLTTSIMATSLMSRVLGELIALYERITLVQGAVWGIDSFSQQDVELGKVLAKQILPTIADDTGALAAQDFSTRGFIEFYRANRT